MTATPSVHPPVPPTWRRAMADALFAALARPDAWVLSLAGFLARGGIVALLLPIVVVPTTPGLAIVVAPALVPLYFGQPSAALALLGGALVVAGVVAIVVGGLVGAWTDLALVRIALEEGEVVRPGLSSRPGLVRRAFGARLLAHLPLAVALAWGATRVVDAVYRELVSPDDVTIPVFVRVLRDVPDAIVVIVAAWLLGEAVGGLAVRQLATGDATSARGALARAVRGVVRAPARSCLTFLVTSIGVAAALVAALVAPAAAWHQVAILSRAAAGPTDLLAGVGLLVALFLTGLVLVAATTAFRAFAWTLDGVRAPVVGIIAADEPARGAGTIGGADDGRPGEWPARHASGRL